MAGSDDVKILTVDAGGGRLDSYVASQINDISRTVVQRLLASGHITVDGRAESASYQVRSGDRITVVVPPPKPTHLCAEPLPLDIVYEDAHVLVVDKAPGMVVHPGAGHRSGTLVNAVMAHCPSLPGIGGEVRPGVVHRLDRDTSGVIVLAKTDQALRDLQSQFRRRTVAKRYTALAVGSVPQDEGIIEAPIGRDSRHRKRMAVRSGGREARTRWRVLAWLLGDHGRRYTLLDVGLDTGRTHQIRVHLAWMGYPLAGDGVYGPPGPASGWPRQFLHARELEINHPVSGERCHFEAPLPRDLEIALSLLADGHPPVS